MIRFRGQVYVYTIDSVAFTIGFVFGCLKESDYWSRIGFHCTRCRSLCIPVRLLPLDMGLLRAVGHIVLSVWDHDMVSDHDLIGTAVFSVDNILNHVSASTSATPSLFKGCSGCRHIHCYSLSSIDHFLYKNLSNKIYIILAFELTLSMLLFYSRLYTCYDYEFLIPPPGWQLK